MEENEQGDGEVEGARATALDLEDAWEAEAKEFTPAARITGIEHCRSPLSVFQCQLLCVISTSGNLNLAQGNTKQVSGQTKPCG